MYGKIKNVPNHQPDIDRRDRRLISDLALVHIAIGITQGCLVSAPQRDTNREATSWWTQTMAETGHKQFHTISET